MSGASDLFDSFLVDEDIIAALVSNEENRDTFYENNGAPSSELEDDLYSYDLNDILGECEYDSDIRESGSVSVNSNDDSSQEKSAKKKYVRKPRIPPHLRVKIPLSELIRSPMTFSEAFNAGDIDAMSTLISKVQHRKSLLRLKNPLETMQVVGNEGTMSYFTNVLQAFPDALLLLKKHKAFPHGKYYVSQSKIEFTGTNTDKQLSKTIVCPKSKQYKSLMDVSEENCKKLKEIEEKLISSGIKYRRVVKIKYTQYVDLKCNRIVLSDMAFRIATLRPL